METGAQRFGNQCSTDKQDRTCNVDTGNIKSEYSHKYSDPKTERTDIAKRDNSSEHFLNSRNKENTVRELHGVLHIADDGHAVIDFSDNFNLSSKDERTDTLFALQNVLGEIRKFEDETGNNICTSDEESDVEGIRLVDNNDDENETDTELNNTATVGIGQTNEDDRMRSGLEAESNSEIKTCENETNNVNGVGTCPIKGPTKIRGNQCHEFTLNPSPERHIIKESCFKNTKTMTGISKKYPKVNSNSTRFKCKLCGDSFSAKSTLRNHMKLHDQEKGDATKTYLSCGVCQKLFTQEQSLALHMQVHTGTQKHECTSCGASFSRKSDLQRHEMIHTGQKPYQCAVCDRRFRLPGELGRHRKIHTGELACKHCGKMYVRMNEFQRHVAKHNDVKGSVINKEGSDDTAFTCTFCSNTFTSDLNLRNHMVLHERGRPTPTPGPNIKTNPHSTQNKSCDQCGIQLSNSSNLYRHIRRMHSKEFHVKCDLCAKTFNTTGALIRHTWISHLNQK